MSWEDLLGHFTRETATVVRPQDAPRELLVHEADEGGAATVRVRLPDGALGITLQFNRSTAFGFLRDGQSADGHLLIRHADGAWSAHLVECKTTLNAKTLLKAANQLRGSLVRIEIIARFLGITLSERRGWLAFREERLSGETTTNPVLLKRPVGASLSPEPAREAHQTWANRLIHDTPFCAMLPFGAIPLDDRGQGSLEISRTNAEA